MAVEVLRKLIDGVWRTVVADAGGSGGSQPVNWCVIDLAIPGDLHGPGTPRRLYAASTMTINSQSGSDFSIGDDPNNPGIGAVLSAGGGRFQCAAYLSPPTDATLDAGSTALRWLWFGAIAGDTAVSSPVNPFWSAGLDMYVPVVPTFMAQSLMASAIGYTAPGGVAAGKLGVSAGDLLAGDIIPLDSSGPYQLLVWQV